MSATVIEFATREQQGPLDSPWGHRLRKLEERIVGNEGDSVQARWEFGKTLLDHRENNGEGKQLPNGVAAEVAKAHGISRTEIKQRMQFAEKYQQKSEVVACATTYRTWNRIKREALPKKPAEPKTFEQRMTDRVTRMINEASTTHDKEILGRILADAAQQLEEKS